MSKWWDKSITLVEGCSPVSDGCKKCWSAGVTHRFHRAKGLTKDSCFNGKVICREDRLDEILKRKKPTRWTIWNDLFHPGVPFEFIDKVSEVTEVTPWHTYQLLTKRPEIMLEFFKWRWNNADQHKLNCLDAKLWKTKHNIDDNCMYVPNQWLGTSVENQKWLDIRAPLLLQIQAAVLFLSIEPMLGPIDVQHYLSYPSLRCSAVIRREKLKAINWVIIGCESNGSHLGRMGEFKNWYEWLSAAYSVVKQCKAAKVPVFIKQIPQIKNARWCLEKDINNFPTKLQRQEYPNENE